MNELQQCALNLLKEIDAICRENGIVYYAAGGTVIGAARHKGFIPWDDDIDIYMTRDNFYKFRQVLKDNPVQGRKLEFREDNPGFYSLVPRYTDESNTLFHRYHLLGNAAAGVIVDVFILDPVPNGRDAQREYMAKSNVYADLTTAFYSYSQRNEDKYLGLYEEYLKRVETEGLEPVIKELEDELFSYDITDCDNYYLRWGSVSHFFPKEMYEEPVDLEFEDMEMMVPTDWFGHLVQLFGTDWHEVPTATESEHVAVMDLENPYNIYYKERDRYIDEEELCDVFNQRKKAGINLQKIRRPMEEWALNQKAKVALALENPDEYYAIQTSNLFIGEPNHNGWHRWHFPKIIEVQDEFLKETLLTYLMGGGLRKAEKLLMAYRAAGISTEATTFAMDKYFRIVAMQKAYYLGEYADCIEQYKDPKNEDLRDAEDFRDYYYLAKSHVELTEDEFAFLVSTVKDGSASPEIIMACLNAMGTFSDASITEETLQESLLKKHRNGVFWQEIKDRVAIKMKPVGASVDGTENDSDSQEEFRYTSVDLVQKELFLECVEFLSENNIDYVLSEELAERVLANGNLGHEDVAKVIYIKATDAERFMDAAEERESRRGCAISWKNNGCLRNFRIYYHDPNTLFAPYNRLEEWQDVGLHIELIPLREMRDVAPSTEKKEKYLAMTLDREEGQNTPLKGKLLRTMGSIHVGKDKTKYTRSLFAEIVKENQERESGTPGYFYRNNTRGGGFDEIRMDGDFFLKSLKKMLWDIEINVPAAVVSTISNKYYVQKTDKVTDPGIFRNMRADINWKEFREIVDISEGKKFNWRKYYKARKNANAKVDKMLKAWQIIQRGRDKIITWNHYKGMIPKLRSYAENGDWDSVRSEMELFSHYWDYYKSQGMSFITEGDLFRIYAGLLEEDQDLKAVETIQKLAELDDKSVEIIGEICEVQR